MATPKAALQAALGTNFEAVGNGVNAEPAARLTIHNQCQPPLLQAKPPPWMFHISPVKLLFEDRMDMDKVCDWFMQTTETRSLAITGRSEAVKKLGESEGFRLIRRQPGAPRTRRRRRAAARGGVADPVGDCSPDNFRAQGTRSRAARGRGEGWNLHHPILNNWWSGKSRKRQRETPTAAPQGHQERRKGDKNCGQADYLADWSDFPSPAVLHVTGTDYKLVPVGNSLPTMWHLGAAGGQQLGTGRQQREEESTCPGRQQQESFLTEAKRQLGCLRECWVLLRNIGDPRALAPSQGAPWASGKSTSVRLHHRKERRWAPAHYKQRTPDPPSGVEGDTEEHQRDSWRTESQQVLSVNRAQGKVIPTTESHPYAHLPASPELGPANSAHLQSPVKSEAQEGFPLEVQPDNLLAGVKWQLIHLKECRVILRKIKPMDSSHLNGLAVYQASNLPSPRPCQDLENKEDNNNSEKAGLHQINPDCYSCEENHNQCLAADVPVFAKGFNSTSELESTVKPEREDLRNTLVDNKWKLRGLKECQKDVKLKTCYGLK
ncbi:hypothetical protein scyTo_0009617 [Scyliorhinus torazame]|uniref:Uncharacterized protein n=1 Tax=Scyliorhinus torazame TaxID=75743 RepID=A0A401NQF6_SCYTO|nr:hypothetical protein [Scyliorhinus torazame]